MVLLHPLGTVCASLTAHKMNKITTEDAMLYSSVSRKLKKNISNLGLFPFVVNSAQPVALTVCVICSRLGSCSPRNMRQQEVGVESV